MALTKTCLKCGDEFTAEYPTKRYCSRQCWLRTYNKVDREHSLRGAHAAGATNIERYRGTGQPHTYVKQRGRHQHRVVMEQKLGRPLEPDEIVHHRDENKKNNHPDNLEVITRSEHTSHHWPDMMAKRKERHGY